jgi:DNA-binding response OmpR family regulator
MVTAMAATDGIGGGAAAQRVLVVDDEPTVREVVATYLARDGFEVRQLADGGRVMEAIEQFDPHLVVLDVMLPVRSGLDVLRELRSRSELPVILLTARSDETDRVLGLELGSDDYLVKPFSPRELTARVRSVLRRTMAHATASSAGRGAQVTLQFGPLVIDRTAREISVDGTIVSLTAKEFDLLAHLAAHPRQVFSRAQLLNAVWDSDPAFQDPATVTVHVGRLRSKIEADPEHPRWIVTVFGVGYRFEP